MKSVGLELAYEELGIATKGKVYDAFVEKHKMTYRDLLNKYYAAVSKCLECGAAMCPMGLDFRVPPKNDEKKWKIIKFLTDNEFSFFGCGCSVGYSPPDSVSELDQWLQDHHRLSNSEKLLAEFKKRA